MPVRFTRVTVDSVWNLDWADRDNSVDIYHNIDMWEDRPQVLVRQSARAGLRGGLFRGRLCLGGRVARVTLARDGVVPRRWPQSDVGRGLGEGPSSEPQRLHFQRDCRLSDAPAYRRGAGLEFARRVLGREFRSWSFSLMSSDESTRRGGSSP